MDCRSFVNEARNHHPPLTSSIRACNPIGPVGIAPKHSPLRMAFPMRVGTPDE
jgi:hypothetical protein